MLNDDVKDFLKTFRILTYGNSKWQVWQDFIFMSACSFSNVVAKNDYVNRENAYLQTINKYNERDRKLFPKLLAKLTMALEHNPEQDFLGKIFMELDLGSRNRGQFFTPYDVCKLMSEINLLDLVQKGSINCVIVQRKYSLQVIFDLDTIAAKTRKILDNNAVDGPLLHQVKQFLDSRPFKIGATETIVYKLLNLCSIKIRHRLDILVQRIFLILNAKTSHFFVFR